MTFWILIVAMGGFAAWITFRYWRLKRAAKLVENAEFAELMRGGQVVDLREASSFQRKHILGARNIPLDQLKVSLNALRKDKPVLIYESTRGDKIFKAAFLLKKAGFKDIYVLSYGLDSWDGKVKEQKIV